MTGKREREREREREGWLANGRRPQFSGNWKTTSIFWQMEDDLIFLANGRQPKSFTKER